MLDLENLNELDHYYRDEILLVHKFLKKCNGELHYGHTPLTNITLNTQYIEFASQCFVLEQVDEAISERKKVAPNWKVALTKWLDDLKSRLVQYSLKYPTEYAVSANGLDNSQHIFRKVYVSITEGKNGFIYDLAVLLVQKYLDTDFKEVIPEYFNQIGDAVFYSYLIGKLQLELDCIQDFESNSVGLTPLTHKKIIWAGTPPEFGAVFEKLLEYGFLSGFNDKKQAALILHKFFLIKNQEGAEIDSDYLYSCFGKNVKKYNPNEFKIPYSKNFDK